MLNYDPIGFLKINYPEQFKACVQTVNCIKGNKHIKLIAQTVLGSSVYYASSKLLDRSENQLPIDDPKSTVDERDFACVIGKCAGMGIVMWGFLDLLHKPK